MLSRTSNFGRAVSEAVAHAANEGDNRCRHKDIRKLKVVQR